MNSKFKYEDIYCDLRFEIVIFMGLLMKILNELFCVLNVVN